MGAPHPSRVTPETTPSRARAARGSPRNRDGEGGQASALPSRTGRSAETTAAPAPQVALGSPLDWSCSGVGARLRLPIHPGGPTAHFPHEGRGSHRAPPPAPPGPAAGRPQAAATGRGRAALATPLRGASATPPPRGARPLPPGGLTPPTPHPRYPRRTPPPRPLLAGPQNRPMAPSAPPGTPPGHARHRHRSYLAHPVLRRPLYPEPGFGSRPL